jgi:hypothetical protein
MKYFYLEPEAVGEIGERTIMDPSFHPPIVTKLHWVVDHWIGDVLVELFPCWIVTAAAMKQIKLAELTGMSIDDVEVTVSDQFHEFHPSRGLPKFVWMKVEGLPGRDDFGVPKGFKVTGSEKPYSGRRFRLAVSRRAIDLLRRLGISHATVEDFSK